MSLRNIGVIHLAREDGVIIVCLPPHTTHKLQPLVAVFMCPFKAYYNQEIETLMENHPFRAVTVYQVGELMKRTYARCATLQVPVIVFEKCGIIPFNSNIFNDHDNTPVKNQNRSNDDENQPEDNGPQQQVLPFHLRPPSVTQASTSTGRSRGSAVVITGSPFKRDLEEKREKNRPSLQ